MNQPRPLKLYLWKKEDRSARTVKTPKENLRIGGGGGEESASEPGLCNGNHMVGGGGSDAPRLLGEAAKQPDTFQETGGKYFLGLNPRLHSLHQEERNKWAREGEKGYRGGVHRRWGKKTDTSGLVPPTMLLEERVNGI